MRITDEVALDCAQEAAGQLRYEIEAAFSQGLPNTPMANPRCG
jgi:amino-acid N-acetyltransferase